MARHEYVTLEAETWTELTNSDVESISVYNNGPELWILPQVGSVRRDAYRGRGDPSFIEVFGLCGEQSLGRFGPRNYRSESPGCILRP